MLYGVAAVELEDRVQTRGHLLATLQRNPGLLLTRRLSEVEVSGAAISPDGRLLASGDRDGVVRFTDLRTWKPSGPSVRLGRPVPEQAMAFSPDGRTVAVGAGSGNRMDVHFVDVATRRARRVRSWRGWVTPSDLQTLLLAYAPDGRHARRRAGDVRGDVRLAHPPAAGAARRPQRADNLGARAFQARAAARRSTSASRRTAR